MCRYYVKFSTELTIYFINNQQTTKRALFILLMRPVSYKMDEKPHNYLMSSGLDLFLSIEVCIYCGVVKM